MAASMKKSLFSLLINFLRKSAGLEHNTISLSIGKISYLDNIGDTNTGKETLVLIHGLGADKDTWVQLSKYLTKTYRVIIPDLPGHGESVQSCSLDYSVEAQSGRIFELLQNLNIKHAHFIGNSMGGAVAIRMAYMWPKIVSSLILIDSYGATKTPSHIYILANRLGSNPMLNINNKSDYKKMLSLAMVKPPYIPEWILDVLAENMSEKAALNKKIYIDSENSNDLTPILSNIIAPSLVIWGKEDKVLHVDNAEMFNQHLPNCTNVVLEKIGHAPMVECPKITSEHILKFLDAGCENYEPI